MSETTQQNTVTYRAWGKDFTGPANSLEAMDNARAYALEGIANGWGDYCKVFFVGKGCMPVEAFEVGPSSPSEDGRRVEWDQTEEGYSVWRYVGETAWKLA